MGSDVGLKHFAVLHLNRRGGIWLYIFWLGSGVTKVVQDGLMIPQRCTLGLMLCVSKTKRLLLHPSCQRLIAGGLLDDRKRTRGVVRTRGAILMLLMYLPCARKRSRANGFAPQLDLAGAYRAGNRSRGQACTVLDCMACVSGLIFLDKQTNVLVLGCSLLDPFLGLFAGLYNSIR